jgi:hypothetical protein
MTRAARGSIAGSSAPRANNAPNMRGAMTVEQDLPAGTKLWLSAWSKKTCGGPWISITAEMDGNGGFHRAKICQGDGTSFPREANRRGTVRAEIPATLQDRAGQG